jgi:hypothetical protein
MNDRQIKTVWQDSSSQFQPMSLGEVHMHAAQFSDVVRKRNLREYIAGYVVVLVFCFYIWFLPIPLLKIGSALTAAAALFVMWQLHRRSSKSQPETDAEAIVEHYRANLVRERDMLASVGSWYLAPFIPGFALFSTGQLIESDQITLGSALLNIGLPAAIFAGIWLLNKNAARRLQRRIDALYPQPVDVERALNTEALEEKEAP